MAVLPCGHRAGDKRPELPFDLLSRDLPRISLPVGQGPIQHQVQSLSCFPNIHSDTDIFLPIKWPKTLASGSSRSPGYNSWFPGPGWTPKTYWVPSVSWNQSLNPKFLSLVPVASVTGGSSFRESTRDSSSWDEMKEREEEEEIPKVIACGDGEAPGEVRRGRKQ